MKVEFVKLLVLTALAATVGCSRSSKKDYEAKERTLAISRLQAELQSSKSTTAWSLISQREFNVTVCLEDQARAERVGESKWRVEGAGLKKNLTSTVDGCLTWLEVVDFEPTVQPIYIPFERKIINLSGEYDAFSFDLRLNPWSGLIGSEPAFNDPRFPQEVKVAPKDQALIALAGLSPSQSSTGGLYVRSVRHTFKGFQNGLSLEFSPELKTLNMDGSVSIQAIDHGRITARAEVLYASEAGTELVPIHKTIEVQNLNFKEGRVFLENLDMSDMQPLIKHKGTYYLRLQLIALDAPSHLKSFEDLFVIGTYDSLGSSDSPLAPKEINRKVDRSKLTLAPSVAKPATTEKPNTKAGTSSQVPSPAEIAAQNQQTGMSFQLGAIGPAMDKITDENTLYRHVSLTLHVDVMGTNPNGGSMDGEEFEITPLDKTSAAPYKKTVQNGQLLWRDVIKHNYYERTDSLKRSIQFKHLRTGKTFVKTADLTPWVRFMVLFVDDDQRNNPTDVRVNTFKQDFVLKLESPCFTQDQRSFSVDPLKLDLKIKLPTTFRFNPTIRRYDEPIFGMNSFEGLRAGYYLLTMAVYNMDVDDPFNHPITVAQKIVHHFGGNLSGQFDLALSDLSFARLRNFAVVDLQILDPETLKLADGKAVDAMTAYTQGLPVTGAQIVPREKLGLRLPVHVFPFTPSVDNCQSVNAPQNFEAAQVKKLVEEIESKKIDLLAVARKWSENQKAKVITSAQKEEWENTGWRQAADRWGFTPYEVKSKADIPQFGFQHETSAEELETALECFYQVNEQNDDMPAKCQYRIGAPIWKFCQAMGIYWADTAEREKLANGMFRHLTPMFFNHCFNKNESRKFVRVRKYLHPYELKKTEKLELIGGYSSDVSVRSAALLGTDFGSETMHENAVNFAVKLFGAKAKMTGNGQDALKKMSEVASRAAGIRPEDALSGEIMQQFEAISYGIKKLNPKANLSAGVEGSYLQSSFRWAFNYQIPYVLGLLNMSSTLTIEETRLELDIERSRSCYSVEPDITPDEWEALLIDQPYETGYRPRLYICFPPKDGAQKIVERYYFVYNNPDQGVMLDNQAASNRWFLTFRGERDYHVFLQNLRAQYDLIYRGEERIPEPIMHAIDNMRVSSLLNRPVFPGVMSAPRPGDENFDRRDNLESDTTKFLRWISHTFNPWENYGGNNTNQNNPEDRVYNRD